MTRTDLRSWRRCATMFVLAIALAGSLAACGKKAPLDPPPGEPDNYGHQYPDPGLE